MGIFAGVEFDHRRLEPHCRVELALLGRDEQADADAGVAQPLDEWIEPVVLPGGVKSALGGAFFAPFGDDAGGVRFVAERDLQHLLGRRHFEVERQAGGSLDAGEIVIADMAAVFAQVRRHPVAAGACDHFGGAHRIGMIAAARVADGGDVIDVDAEAEPVAPQIQFMPRVTEAPGSLA